MKKAQSRKVVATAGKVAPRIVGRVTPGERDEIQALFERRSGLKELVATLHQSGGMLTNDALYEKVVADIGRTSTRFQKWWDDKAKAYGWENVPGCHWTIDFDTCEISLSK